MTTPEFEQLQQISAGPVWDGNLISKDATNKLYKAGIVLRGYGYSTLSESGLSICVTLGLLKP